ncbi:hypothetical protein ACJJTC_012157 [Scirpophaga incertulas]
MKIFVRIANERETRRLLTNQDSVHVYNACERGTCITATTTLGPTSTPQTTNMFKLFAVAYLIGAAVAAPFAPVGIAAVDTYSVPNYSFNYAVNDPHTGDNKAQSEVRAGDNVRGSYSLADPDGTVRVVDYASDPHTGFNAVVKRLGTAVHPTPVVAPVITKQIVAPVVTPIATPIIGKSIIGYGGLGSAGYGAPGVVGYGAHGAVGYGVPGAIGYGVPGAIGYGVSGAIGYGAGGYGAGAWGH